MTTQSFIPVQGTGKNLETIEHVDEAIATAILMMD